MDIDKEADKLAIIYTLIIGLAMIARRNPEDTKNELRKMIKADLENFRAALTDEILESQKQTAAALGAALAMRNSSPTREG